MSQEIAVIGTPEFTTGFRLAGVRTVENVADEDKENELDDTVEDVFDDEDVGIVVMADADMEFLSRGVKRNAETSIEPTLVTLGGEGAGSGGLRGQIKRAIGIDLMDDT